MTQRVRVEMPAPSATLRNPFDIARDRAFQQRMSRPPSPTHRRSEWFARRVWLQLVLSVAAGIAMLCAVAVAQSLSEAPLRITCLTCETDNPVDPGRPLPKHITDQYQR